MTANTIYTSKNTLFSKFARTKSKETTFEYLSGICGIGKTEVLIDFCVQESTHHQKKIIFAVPTTELCDELSLRFRGKSCVPLVIHSKNNFSR